MFKTDKKSLEKLSYEWDEEYIARLRSTLDYLNNKDLATFSNDEYIRLTNGLDEIAKMKLDGKVYAFCCRDYWGGKDVVPYRGVELYLRQGDSLRDFLVIDYRPQVISVEQASDFLRKNDKNKIYTGHIDGEFLGLPSDCDDEDPFSWRVLEDYQIKDFEDNGIEVVKLDSLI